jgi:ATP-dependent Clp protease ATP-binding subunit ClpA
MQKILDLELQNVQKRVLSVAGGRFILRYTDRAKAFLLREGTNDKYGARPLKRTIERNVVLPLSNLIATRQISEGDVILVELPEGENCLVFMKQKMASAVPNRFDTPFGRKTGFRQFKTF